MEPAEGCREAACIFTADADGGVYVLTQEEEEGSDFKLTQR